MEFRNVQRTGKMHYIYLPTTWCKKHRISSDTKVIVTETNDGLLISPESLTPKGKAIDLTLPAKHKDTLINVIMASNSIKPV